MFPPYRCKAIGFAVRTPTQMPPLVVPIPWHNLDHEKQVRQRRQQAMALNHDGPPNRHVRGWPSQQVYPGRAEQTSLPGHGAVRDSATLVPPVSDCLDIRKRPPAMRPQLALIQAGQKLRLSCRPSVNPPSELPEVGNNWYTRKVLTIGPPVSMHRSLLGCPDKAILRDVRDLLARPSK